MIGLVKVTNYCNRRCIGCCNTLGNSVKTIKSISDLLSYDEVHITGGEPLILGKTLVSFVSELKNLGYNGKIGLYTASWGISGFEPKLITYLDKIFYTIHTDVSVKDVEMLHNLNKDLSGLDIDSTLYIDSRVYDNIDKSALDSFSCIKSLIWESDCKPATDENLLYLDIKHTEV